MSFSDMIPHLNDDFKKENNDWEEGITPKVEYNVQIALKIGQFLKLRLCGKLRQTAF